MVNKVNKNLSPYNVNKNFKNVKILFGKSFTDMHQSQACGATSKVPMF